MRAHCHAAGAADCHVCAGGGGYHRGAQAYRHQRAARRDCCTHVQYVGAAHEYRCPEPDVGVGNEHTCAHASAGSHPDGLRAPVGQPDQDVRLRGQWPLPGSRLHAGDSFPTVTAAQVCVLSYSSSVRDVSTSTKDQVYAEYGITSHSTGQYEVDHFVSPELGGSNDISNLFPEAANPRPGFHEKDRVENYLHDQVCKGVITLADAQREIAKNWPAVHLTLPSVSTQQAPTATQAEVVVPTNTAASVVVPGDTPEPMVAPADTATQEVAPTDTQPPPATEAPTVGARVRVGALCDDNSDSSATGSGACSQHGGVKCRK